MQFKNRIVKDLTSGAICKFKCELYNECCYGECVRHLNVRIGQHIGYHHIPKRKLSLGTALQVICYFATIQHSLMINYSNP